MCPVTVNGAAESSPSRVRTHTSHPHILSFPAHHILPTLLTSPHVERFISEQFSSEAALILHPPKSDHKATPIQKSYKTPQGQLTTTQKTITPHQSAGDPKLVSASAQSQIAGSALKNTSNQNLAMSLHTMHDVVPRYNAHDSYLTKSAQCIILYLLLK